MRASIERIEGIEPVRRTAIVLAGGRSLRMGVDKASIVFQGEPLLTRVINRLSSLWNEIFVVAAPGQTLPPIVSDSVRVLRDEYPGKGPLGGIYTGLKAAETGHCSVVACDMPFVNAQALAEMLTIAQEGNYEAVIPLASDQLHYLHAVYRRTLLPSIEQALCTDQLALHAFVDDKTIRVMSEYEMKALDSELQFHLNVNAPKDLVRAAKH